MSLFELYIYTKDPLVCNTGIEFVEKIVSLKIPTCVTPYKIIYHFFDEKLNNYFYGL